MYMTSLGVKPLITEKKIVAHQIDTLVILYNAGKSRASYNHTNQVSPRENPKCLRLYESHLGVFSSYKDMKCRDYAGHTN